MGNRETSIRDKDRGKRPKSCLPEKKSILGNLFVASYRLELISCHPPKTAYSATTGEVNGWNETEYHYFDFENDAIAFCTEEMNKLIRYLEGKNE